MIKKTDSNKARLKRHKRVRAKISGTNARPRFNVFRSDKHIYVQIIDDVSGKTLVAASSNEKDFSVKGSGKEVAKQVGTNAAARAIKAGITEVVFDRGGYIFHGRVKELADGAREGGLKF